MSKCKNPNVWFILAFTYLSLGLIATMLIGIGHPNKFKTTHHLLTLNCSNCLQNVVQKIIMAIWKGYFEVSKSHKIK
jgi:hypothetical protein